MTCILPNFHGLIYHSLDVCACMCTCVRACVWVWVRENVCVLHQRQIFHNVVLYWLVSVVYLMWLPFNSLLIAWQFFMDYHSLKPSSHLFACVALRCDQKCIWNNLDVHSYAGIKLKDVNEASVLACAWAHYNESKRQNKFMSSWWIHTSKLLTVI